MALISIYPECTASDKVKLSQSIAYNKFSFDACCKES